MRFSTKNAISEMEKYDNLMQTFSEYSPAYITTNEELRSAMEALEPAGAKVLTCAGSGDQPMWFSLGNASKVDTFDISFCSKVVMDIKTMLLGQVTHSGYCEILGRIYNEPRFLSHLADMPGLPQESKRFIKMVHANRVPGMKWNITGRQWGRIFYEKHLPDAAEYEKMQNAIKKPYRFIWTDVMNLAEKISQKYDIIYLSNIFQYIGSVENMRKIVDSLMPHLTDSGTMMLYATWFIRPYEHKKFSKLQDWLGDKATLYHGRDREKRMTIMNLKKNQRS